MSVPAGMTAYWNIRFHPGVSSLLNDLRAQLSGIDRLVVRVFVAKPSNKWTEKFLQVSSIISGSTGE